MIRNVLAGVGVLVIGWVTWTAIRVSRERWLAEQKFAAENPYLAAP